MVNIVINGVEFDFVEFVNGKWNLILWNLLMENVECVLKLR